MARPRIAHSFKMSLGCKAQSYSILKDKPTSISVLEGAYIVRVVVQ